MNTHTDGAAIRWHLIANRCFEDFEVFRDSTRGWDFEFHQLTPGSSSIELLQFGRPEFMLSRFHLEQAYDQSGCTPPNSLTFGLCEEQINEVTTPDGLLHQDGIICFPSDGELKAISQPHFKGYTLSISKALIDNVAESCALQRVSPDSGSVQQVLSCKRTEIFALRSALRHACRSMAYAREVPGISEINHNLEFDLVRHLLVAIAGSRPADRLNLTGRKRLAFQRARDYIEANVDKPITVLELAQASGCGVRTLELVFRHYFNITPKAYLKSRRLAAVQRELACSSPSISTVSEKACRWGFWHMSQFAADYRRFHGELPSETLNKTPRLK